jgi:DNA mismatch repair protein MutL
MTIRRLPPLLVNQIAAGEVIERPASVVKELVENALDAGATRIEVAIENGGRDLVRVVDDGAGIATDQLQLAVAPHATSKIEVADDLDAIATMGFRGEALASIASVSRLSIVSRPADQAEAAEIRIEGDREQPPRPAGGRPGTTIHVRNLFFNTPARRRFLRTDQTEAGRVTDVVETLALSHPAVGFVLTVDGRGRVDVPAGQDARARVLAVLGPAIEPELLEVDGPGVWGLVGRPSVTWPNARGLRVFLNGRPIADRTINHAIREAFRGLIAPDRHPVAVLHLDVEPSLVDVNVHPAKAEVRFRDPSLVHRAVRKSIQAALTAEDLVPEVSLDKLAATAVAAPTSPRAIVDSFHRLDTRQKGFVYSELKEALADEPAELFAAAPASAAAPPPKPVATETMVLDDCFIVTREGDDLLIIDQHALHERVMFEKLKERITSGPLHSQRLLVPVTVEATARMLERLETMQPLLERIGIDAEPIGPRTIAVHGFTTLLSERKVEAAPFLRVLLEQDPAGDAEAALHEVLDMMSCKAAVKAGDKLTDEELAELLRLRRDVERSSRCPHGRPTTLRLTPADLERQFGRSPSRR